MDQVDRGQAIPIQCNKSTTMLTQLVLTRIKLVSWGHHSSSYESTLPRISSRLERLHRKGSDAIHFHVEASDPSRRTKSSYAHLRHVALATGSAIQELHGRAMPLIGRFPLAAPS